MAKVRLREEGSGQEVGRAGCKDRQGETDQWGRGIRALALPAQPLACGKTGRGKHWLRPYSLTWE